MANRRVSNTALGAAICRLIEQYQPENMRLFEDAFIKNLIAAPLRVMMQSKGLREYTVRQTDAIMPGIYGVQVCRTRFIDEAIEKALAQGITQVVILGAGLDTRAYRLTRMKQARIFEVDLPDAQKKKKERLRKSFGKLPEHVTFISLDFDTQSLDAAFAESVFDAAQPVVFLWEGVTQYLPQEAVARTLTFIGKAAPGSILVFTYVLRSIIERRSDLPGAEKLMDTVAKSSPWLFGLEPSEAGSYLAPFGLKLVADVGNADYLASFLRASGRELVVSECERIGQAMVEQHP